MWMVERDPHLLAAVLKDKDVANIGPARELAIAVGPDIGEQPEAIIGQRGERAFVLVGVDDDFALTAWRDHRGKTDLKDRGLISARRNFTHEPRTVGA